MENAANCFCEIEEKCSSGIPENALVLLIPNVEYATTSARALHLHLLVPANLTGPMPLLVYIKGCRWGAQSPQYALAHMPALVPYAMQGYVVASVEHRLAREAAFPAQIQDVKAAIRFLRAHAALYKIDPAKIGIWGDSSGGHLASLAGTSSGVEEFDAFGPYRDQSSSVQAVIDLYGPTDFLQMSRFPCAIDHDSITSPESILVGGRIQEKTELVQQANPIRYMTGEVPPFLIMHGDQDNLVPYNQSVLLYEALRQSGHDATMYKVRGAGHGLNIAQPHIKAIVQAFFDSHLSNPSRSGYELIQVGSQEISQFFSRSSQATGPSSAAL